MKARGGPFVGPDRDGYREGCAKQPSRMEKLSQKEFYDALIRVDVIVAIEVRVR